MRDTSAEKDPLARLPVDVLVDSVLPAFPTSDVIRLGRTCRRWHTFLTTTGQDTEVFWMRRCIAEFNFPVRASGRRTDWFQLYSRLAQSAAYVWGQNENGRLGLPDSTFRLPAPLRSRLLEGGLVLPTRLELPAPPVSIVAGGWSFHALTADGKVVSWGTMNGGSWSRDDAPLHHDGRALKPSLLPQTDVIGPVAQLEAGRSHAIMLGQDGKVYEMRAFGRVVNVADEGRRWGGADTSARVTSVHAGWDYSAVLTTGGDVFVWWEPGLARFDRGARAAGEDDLTSPSTQGVVFSLELDTLRLPPLPSVSAVDDKIKLLACGDNFVVALTEHSRLYFLSLAAVPDPARPHGRQGALNDPEDSPVRSRESMARLDAEMLSGRRTWRLMTKFCNSEELANLESIRDAPLAQEVKITHVSAHFNHFAAYSVPSSTDLTSSLVLLGDSDWHEQSEPKLVRELQGLGVIKIAQGDYHNVALTSSGQLYSWGAFSGGALGLGHPVLSNTPLSATPSQTSSDDRPGATRTRQPPALLPGFAPNRPRMNDRPRAPERIDRPTRIEFDGDSRRGSRGGHTFVYAVTASGWHSGALAVNLDSPDAHALPSNAEAQDEEEETLVEPLIKLRNADDEERDETIEAANEGNGIGPTGGTWMARLGRPFRVGLAGGGTVNQGGAGGAVRPPSR
ncbi:hypothetical protein JCM11491_001344 [Sporobolomyces phaffii]